MQSNPGPRPTVGSHSAIETVISGAYARDENGVFRCTNLSCAKCTRSSPSRHLSALNLHSLLNEKHGNQVLILFVR